MPANLAFCIGGSAGQEVAALARLVLQLQSTCYSYAPQEEAARMIERLTLRTQENRNAIIAAGAVPPLVALLRADPPDVQEAAAGALFELARASQHNQDAIIAAGSVPLLIELLTRQICKR